MKEEEEIDKTKILDPRSLLYKKVNDKYRNEDINRLSIDLLDNLSVGRVDEAKIISDRYYDEHYESIAEESNPDISNDVKEISNEGSVQSVGDVKENSNEGSVQSVDDIENESYETVTVPSEEGELEDNKSSKQMSFDDY